MSLFLHVDVYFKIFFFFFFFLNSKASYNTSAMRMYAGLPVVASLRVGGVSMVPYRMIILEIPITPITVVNEIKCVISSILKQIEKDCPTQ